MSIVEPVRPHRAKTVRRRVYRTSDSSDRRMASDACTHGYERGIQNPTRTYEETALNKLELKVPPLILVMLCMLLMWGISRLYAELDASIPGALVLAGLLAAGGVFIAVAGVINFRQARTTVDPTAPERTTSIVSSGIYKSSRNPMYLGFALCLTAWAVWLENPPAFLVLPGFVLYMNLFQIRPEERMLSKKFGDEYTRYRQSVRRWL